MRRVDEREAELLRRRLVGRQERGLPPLGGVHLPAVVERVGNDLDLVVEVEPDVVHGRAVVPGDPHLVDGVSGDDELRRVAGADVAAVRGVAERVAADGSRGAAFVVDRDKRICNDAQ